MRVKIVLVSIIFLIITLFCILAPPTLKTYYNLSYDILVIDYSWSLIVLSLSILIVEEFSYIRKRNFFFLSVIIFLSGLVIDIITLSIFTYIEKFNTILDILILLFLGFILIYQISQLYLSKILGFDKSKVRIMGVMFAVFTNPVIGILNEYIHTSGITIYSIISHYLKL